MAANGWTPQSVQKLVMTIAGEWYVQKETYSPIDPTSALTKLVKDIGWVTPMLGPGSFVYFSGQTSIVMQVISKIPFRAEMLAKPNTSTDKDAPKLVYVPAFGASVGIELDPPFVYRPPADTLLVLGVDMRGLGHLVMIDKETGSLYHPIVPNVYESGKLCVGDGFKFPKYNRLEGLESYLKAFLAQWSTTKWNGDLAGAGGTRPSDWLRFDEKTKENILPKGDKAWKNYTGGPIVPPTVFDQAFHSLFDYLHGEGEGAKL